MTDSMELGARSLMESEARDRCRATVRRLKSRIDKIEKTHVFVRACHHWPLGLVTTFNGWVDLLTRLRTCESTPSLIKDGIYVRDDAEYEDAKRVRRKLEYTN